MKTNDIHIALPASKSLSNRWLVLNHLLGGRFHLSGLSTADDTVLFRQLLQQLKEGTSSVYYCQNAGTVARFLTAILAITPGTHFVTGDERLCQRPIAPLVDALNGMGLSVSYAGQEGAFPLNIVGSVPSRKMAFIDPSQSSQFVSALMLIGTVMPKGISISLTSKSVSSSYIAMTAQILREAGFEVSQHANTRKISVQSAKTPVSAPARKTVTIEPDWSSASYFYELAALCPDMLLRLTGLPLESPQGDSVAAEYFGRLGVATREVRSPYHRATSSLRIQGGGAHEDRQYFTFRKCPDLMPAVAVACAALGVSAELAGLAALVHKESDRVAAIMEELQSMGVRAAITKEGNLRLYPSKLCPTRPIRTYGDHRIAMAFAPLQFLFPDLQIENPEVVSKSFPGFWEQIAQCRPQQ